MATAPAIPVNPTLSQRLAGLDQAQRLRIGLGLALFIAIGIIGLMMGRQARVARAVCQPGRQGRWRQSWRNLNHHELFPKKHA